MDFYRIGQSKFSYLDIEEFKDQDSIGARTFIFWTNETKISQIISIYDYCGQIIIQTKMEGLNALLYPIEEWWMKNWIN